MGSISVVVDQDICDISAEKIQQTLQLAAKVLVANKDLVEWAVCKYVSGLLVPSGTSQVGTAEYMRARIDSILSGASPTEWLIGAMDATDLGSSSPCWGDADGTTAKTFYEGSRPDGTEFYYYDDSPLGAPSPLASAVGSYDEYVNDQICNLAAIMAHELTHFVDPNYSTTDIGRPRDVCTSFPYAVRAEVQYYLTQRYLRTGRLGKL